MTGDFEDIANGLTFDRAIEVVTQRSVDTLCQRMGHPLHDALEDSFRAGAEVAVTEVVKAMISATMLHEVQALIDVLGTVTPEDVT